MGGLASVSLCLSHHIRVTWGTGGETILSQEHIVLNTCLALAAVGKAGTRWQGQHFAWVWSRSKPLVITMLNKHPLSLYTMSSLTLFGRPRERRFVFVTHAHIGCRQSHSKILLYTTTASDNWNSVSLSARRSHVYAKCALTPTCFLRWGIRCYPIWFRVILWMINICSPYYYKIFVWRILHSIVKKNDLLVVASISCLHYGTMPLFGVRRANRRRDIVPPHRHVFYLQHSARILHTHSAAVPKITIILTEYLMFTPRTYIHRYCKYYMHMTRSQMLRIVHCNLPAKFWRLLGGIDNVSR